MTLDALVRHAGAAGHEQAAIVGTPADDPDPPVADLPPASVHPLRFGPGGPGGPACGFLLPGMSDVMPYPSRRFSDLTAAELVAYRDAWTAHVAPVVAAFRPDVIHAHHLWLLSAMVARSHPSVPVVIHSHATGLRQMELCPHLADEVRAGCARARHVVALHRLHADRIRAALDLPAGRVSVVGAGYRDDLFSRGTGGARDPGAIVYAGKYSAAKGLPHLLDAFERIADRRPGATLHVVGDGAGDEAEALRARMTAMAPRVVLHGMVSQARLAELLRRAQVLALPSFYEGLPLVLVEAYACGCRLVATGLPVVTEELGPALGDALHVVAAPGMIDVDRPRPEGLPAFGGELTAALLAALDAPPVAPKPAVLARFGWRAVYERVETVWRQVAGG